MMNRWHFKRSCIRDGLRTGLIAVMAMSMALAIACSEDDSSEYDDDPDAGAEDTGGTDTDDPSDAGGDVDDVGDDPDADASVDTGDEFEPSEGMAFVPEGIYRRGCDDDVHDCSILEVDQPAHEVFVSAFEIDKRVVTEAEYDKCVDGGVCDEPNHDDFYDGTGADYPVVNVSSEQAKTYCEWVDKRLPTEAEWEKAARSDDERIYPWGDDEPNCERTNYDECDAEIEAVGAHPGGHSPYGVEDMAGNVRNWTADWFDGDYYEDSPSEDPTGPDSGDNRAVRGASFFDGENQLPVWSRHSLEQPGWSFDTGFRCARSVGD